MKSISKLNKGFRFLLCVIDIFSKYAYFIPLKDNIDQLGDIVSEYNNTYHRTITMKPVDVKDNAYIDSIKKVNDKDPKFKFDNRVKISKYKNLFC